MDYIQNQYTNRMIEKYQETQGFTRKKPIKKEEKTIRISHLKLNYGRINKNIND